MSILSLNRDLYPVRREELPYPTRGEISQLFRGVFWREDSFNANSLFTSKNPGRIDFNRLKLNHARRGRKGESAAGRANPIIGVGHRSGFIPSDMNRYDSHVAAQDTLISGDDHNFARQGVRARG